MVKLKEGDVLMSIDRKKLKQGETIYSPMVSLEALFTIIVIDTYDGRDVGTFDVIGEYFHAEIPKNKHFRLNLKGGF